MFDTAQGVAGLGYGAGEALQGSESASFADSNETDSKARHRAMNDQGYQPTSGDSLGIGMNAEPEVKQHEGVRLRMRMKNRYSNVSREK